MSAIVYRVRIRDWAEWVQLTADGEAADDEELMIRMETILDSALSTLSMLRVQKLNEDGDWEELG